MNRDRLLPIALSIVVLIFIAVWPASAQPPAPPSPTLVPPGPPQAEVFAPGEVLVKFKPGTTASARGLAAAQVAAQEMDHIPQIGVRRWKVTPGKELEAIAALKKNPTVQYAEPNYYVYATDTTPNDPYYSGYQWNLPKINAPKAWDISVGSISVTIAIVDTGVDLTHPDLASKIVPGWDFVNGDSDPSDDDGHGTHVAGIAAAVSNNGVGVAGMSWGAGIMPVKVLDSAGTGTYYQVAQGIQWAASNGAKVINLSLGGYGYSSTLQDAVDYAYSRGSVVVAAAGNDGISSPLYPASLNHVISVAATDSNDQRWAYSNYNSAVDIAAPGVDILSTWPSSWYAFASGTSMAVPHVSGLAALIWTVAPDVTNDQVESTMESTAVDLGATGRDDYFGWGRIDAYAALKKASPTLSASPASLFYMADDTTDPGSKRVTVSNSAYNQVIAWAATVPTSTAWLTVSPLTGTATTSSPATLSVQASRPAAYGTYTSPITITSTTQYVQDSPQVVNVTLFYTSTIPRVYLPIIFNNH